MVNGINNYGLEKLLGLQNTSSVGSTNSTDTNESAISFASADSENSSIEDIESGYLEAEAALKGDSEVEETEETDKVEDTEASEATKAAGASAAVSGTTTVESEEAKKIKEEIEELQDKKDKNEEKMEKIEANIEKLAKSAEKNIMEAAKAQEDAVAEHEEETQKVLSENIQKYIEANKEGGEGMSKDELQANIKGALPSTPEVGDAVAALAAASEDVSEIDANLSELNDLISDTQSIENDIALKQSEYEAAVNVQDVPSTDDYTSDTDDATCQPTCEPQGFQDNEGNQYDFFIDKDGNGDLSNESEFLGYEGGKEGQEAAWSEMTDLDTNLDGVVDADELTAGGVMVYKTDADGNQQAMTIEEAFGKDSDLAISTTQDAVAKEGVGPNNFTTGTGSENNELWGTFDVTLNGESLSGYQTNDDLDWLKDNYNFTDYANGTSNAGNADSSVLEYSEDLQTHANFFEIYTAKSAEYKEEIQAGYENLGLAQDEMDGMNETALRKAEEKANNFFNSLEAEDEEEEPVENDETAAAAASSNTTAASDSEDDEEEDEEELLEAA